ncbi:MAG: GTP-binding protein, partial [bacterium]|nr:GTP-binding protein [bacterium]
MKDTADLLRFVTCGSVDDGKSTLIARLLHDTALIFEDEPANVEAASRIWGARGDGIDLALVVDGLEAEREQGITIDVAYHCFQTPRRRFIVADTPGHVRYTRNLAIGASTADLALILVDAREGLLTQTFRHAAIASLLGIPHVILAVNKMDLVDWDEGVFQAIEETFRHHAARLGFSHADAVPVSAVTGANVLERSNEMPWYRGESLLTILESASAGRNAAAGPFRMPVQSVG